MALEQRPDGRETIDVPVLAGQHASGHLVLADDVDAYALVCRGADGADDVDAAELPSPDPAPRRRRRSVLAEVAADDRLERKSPLQTPFRSGADDGILPVDTSATLVTEVGWQLERR